MARAYALFVNCTLDACILRSCLIVLLDTHLLSSFTCGYAPVEFVNVLLDVVRRTRRENPLVLVIGHVSCLHTVTLQI